MNIDCSRQLVTEGTNGRTDRHTLWLRGLLSEPNKTQYFRLCLYWLLFWCLLIALWLLTDCSLTAHWLLTYSWLIAWRFELEWWILTVLDKFEPNGRTNEQRLWLLGLLDGAKNTRWQDWIMLMFHNSSQNQIFPFWSRICLFVLSLDLDTGHEWRLASDSEFWH